MIATEVPAFSLVLRSRSWIPGFRLPRNTGIGTAVTLQARSPGRNPAGGAGRGAGRRDRPEGLAGEQREGLAGGPAGGTRGRTRREGLAGALAGGTGGRGRGTGRKGLAGETRGR